MKSNNKRYRCDVTDELTTYACNKNKGQPKSIFPQMCIANLVAAISAAASFVIETGVLSFTCPLTYERENMCNINVRGKMQLTAFSSSEIDSASVVSSVYTAKKSIVSSDLHRR